MILKSKTRSKFLYWAAASIFCLVPQTAFAIFVSISGTTAYLQGPIIGGDLIKFKDAISSKQIKIVELNSTGGSPVAAYNIAKLIRSQRISTYVDASQAHCGSACTVIFAGGISRYYANSGNIVDHLGGTNEPGLGFHTGWKLDPSTGKRVQKRVARVAMKAFKELGASKAANLTTKANMHEEYYISGKTALSLGIATSLRSP